MPASPAKGPTRATLSPRPTRLCPASLEATTPPRTGRSLNRCWRGLVLSSQTTRRIVAREPTWVSRISIVRSATTAHASTTTGRPGITSPRGSSSRSSSSPRMTSSSGRPRSSGTTRRTLASPIRGLFHPGPPESSAMAWAFATPTWRSRREMTRPSSGSSVRRWPVRA